jgi:hypothetical protein
MQNTLHATDGDDASKRPPRVIIAASAVRKPKTGAEAVMVQATPPPSHWDKHAQQWTHVKAPLRPCAEDIALIEQVLARHFPDRASREALMLGLTPELASNDWAPVRKPVGRRQHARDDTTRLAE